MHDDDELRREKADSEEIRRQIDMLDQHDPEIFNRALEAVVKDRLPKELARIKRNLTDEMAFVQRDIGSYDYNELGRLRTYSFLLLLWLRYHPTDPAPTVEFASNSKTMMEGLLRPKIEELHPVELKLIHKLAFSFLAAVGRGEIT